MPTHPAALARTQTIEISSPGSEVAYWRADPDRLQLDPRLHQPTARQTAHTVRARRQACLPPSAVVARSGRGNPHAAAENRQQNLPAPGTFCTLPLYRHHGAAAASEEKTPAAADCRKHARPSGSYALLPCFPRREVPFSLYISPLIKTMSSYSCTGSGGEK